VTKKAAHHPTVGIALKLSLLMLSRVFAIAQVLWLLSSKESNKLET
jgi:hypothetical protein